MVPVLRDIYYQLVQDLEIETRRYLFEDFDISPRLVGLVGPRGVGKTILLLQTLRDRIPSLRRSRQGRSTFTPLPRTSAWTTRRPSST